MDEVILACIRVSDSVSWTLIWKIFAVIHFLLALVCIFLK